jgi:hypothetical protein
MSAADAFNIIPVKDAVKSAIGYVGELGEVFPAHEPRLEETEYDDVHKDWLITLSFRNNTFSSVRINKLFRIDAGTGKVVAMKNR